MPNYPTSVDTDATLLKAVDLASTTLSSALTAAATTIALTSAASFDANGGRIRIEDEIIAYTGKSGNSLTGGTRGYSSTTAAAHPAGATVILCVAADYHNNLKDTIINLEKYTPGSVRNALMYADIDTAKADLPAAGEILDLPIGTYTPAAALTGIVGGTWFKGHGKGKSIVKAGTNLNADLISYATGVSWVKFSDLTLDGNQANQSGAGPYYLLTRAGTGNSQLTLERIEGLGSKGGGFWPQNFSFFNAHGLYLHDGGRATANDIALNFTGSDYALVENVTVKDWNGNGIWSVVNANPTLAVARVVNSIVTDLAGLTTPQAVSINSYDAFIGIGNYLKNIPASGFDTSYNNYWINIGNVVLNAGKDQGGPCILCSFGGTPSKYGAIVLGNILKAGIGFSAEDPSGVLVFAVDGAIAAANSIETTRAGGSTTGIGMTNTNASFTLGRWIAALNTIYGPNITAASKGIDINGRSGGLVGPGIVALNYIERHQFGLRLDFVNDVLIGPLKIKNCTTPVTITNCTNVYGNKQVESYKSLVLSAAGEDIEVFHALRDALLLRARLVYTEASSADVGVTVRIGKFTATGPVDDNDFYWTGTSEVSKAKGYVKDLESYIITAPLSQQVITAGDTVTFGTAGSKTGLGKIRLVLDMVEYG